MSAMSSPRGPFVSRRCERKEWRNVRGEGGQRSLRLRPDQDRRDQPAGVPDHPVAVENRESVRMERCEPQGRPMTPWRGRPVRGRPRQEPGEPMRVRSIWVLLDRVCESAMSDFGPNGVTDLFMPS